MEKRGIFEPPEEVVEDIYQWVKYEYFSRLLPRIDSWMARVKKGEIEGVLKDYTDMFKLLDTKKWIIENMNLPNLVTVNSTKLTANAFLVFNDEVFDVNLIFKGKKNKTFEDKDDQRSSFYDEDKIIDLFFSAFYLRYFTKDHIEWALGAMKEDIDHECSHLGQYFSDSDRLVGLPPKKVWEEGADVEGYILKKKRPGKTVRRNKQIDHGLRDIEFWPNLRTRLFQFREALSELPREERRAKLNNLIEDDPSLSDMEIGSPKRNLFLKHLLSNLQDLL